MLYNKEIKKGRRRRQNDILDIETQITINGSVNDYKSKRWDIYKVTMSI